MNFRRSLVLLTALGLAAACGESPSTNTPLSSGAPTPAASEASPAAPADLMAEGRKLYAANCAACHKENGTGGKMTIEGTSIDPDDLTSAKIKGFPDEKLYGYIYNGIEDEGMPAFKDRLSEAQIREVVRYVRAEIQKLPVADPTRRPGGVD